MAARRDVSRSTSPREILPLLYGLAVVAPPAPARADDYPGYPLVADEYVGAAVVSSARSRSASRWLGGGAAGRRTSISFIKQATKEASHDEPEA